MGARIVCPRCHGAGGSTTGRLQVDCGVCNGTGWMELPVEQIMDALRPHIANGLNLLKKHLIAYAQQRKVQKALENPFRTMGR